MTSLVNSNKCLKINTNPSQTLPKQRKEETTNSFVKVILP